VEHRVTDGPALGRFTPSGGGPVVTVRLRDAPVRIWRRSSEHHDELMREMALLALAPEPAHDLPRRLVELVEVLGTTYAGASARPEQEREAALAAGLDRIDLAFEVPASAGEAAQALGAILREAEEFCRTGGALLTLAQPEVQERFNRWYLDEVSRQIAGEEPTPWSGPWD
jgi:hypothetical protein